MLIKMWPTIFYFSVEFIFFLSRFYSIAGIFNFFNSSKSTSVLKCSWHWLVCFHSNGPEMQIREQREMVLWEVSCMSLKKCILKLSACLQCHWGRSLIVLILLISYFFNLNEQSYIKVNFFGLLKMQINRFS